MADVADQWLRSDREPSEDEWASSAHRSARLAALMNAWEEELIGSQ
jgi:hypothetical protein